MDTQKIVEDLAWNVRMALVAVGMLLAMPLILIGYIVVRVSEERELRALAADAGMTLDEYQASVNRMAIDQIARINKQESF